MIRLRWLSILLGLAVANNVYLPSGWAVTTPGVECDPKDPDLCSQAILEGQKALLSGQVLSTKLAITLGQKAEWNTVRWDLERKRLEEIHQIDLSLEKEKARIAQEAMQAQIALFQKRLAEAEKVKWYREPWVVATTAIVVTTAVFALAVKGASLLK